MLHNIAIFTELFNEIEARTSLDKSSLKVLLTKTISKVYGGIDSSLILEDGTVSVPFKNSNGIFFKDYVVSQKKASEILSELQKLIRKEVLKRDIEKYLKAKNGTLINISSLVLREAKYILKLKDEAKRGFLKDFIFHIRRDDLLPNDLKNMGNNLDFFNNFKVLVSANKFDKKLIFCRRFCKEVLIDIFYREFTSLNNVLGTNYSYSNLYLTYNTKEKYIGYKVLYKDEASGFFKKTLLKNLRASISKNLVISYKKTEELN